MAVLEAILAYLIGIAVNERSSAIATAREESLRKILDDEQALRDGLKTGRSLRDEVQIACTETARKSTVLTRTPQQEVFWRLLSDDVFQVEFTEWLRIGGITEGADAKMKLGLTIENALRSAGAPGDRIHEAVAEFFESLEKIIFSNTVLSNWRHQLSLDFLREQVAILRQYAEQAAGVYSPQQQKAALDKYCAKALEAWDILDLSNLPEGDIHIATQSHLLRQLYMPLRISIEPSNPAEDDEAALLRIEQERELRRQLEAARLSEDEAKSVPKVSRNESRAAVGECLKKSRRLVILGDPGAGKTTMLRWMATAYLLRHNQDKAISEIPDASTLPAEPWIPILIRCRDLGEADLCRSFKAFLGQHLSKTELLPDEANIVQAIILERIAAGRALLLIDGLDEISNVQVRMMFCQELERTAARYPDVPLIATSRIVGYRDMPYRMRSGFEHGVICELVREDKDLFAKRWVEVTEQHHPAKEREKRATELLEALHSSDRIERLTGNPMLLTTLALVKRKVGKLPNRRTKLYFEAVSVLLNWNPVRYEIIDENEAIPQLGFLAYEMCRRGVQRLNNEDVLQLLERVRIEYPNVRSMKGRSPQAFLDLMEARSSILIKSGNIWHRRKEQAVWEFRHLTFQEYLAARAILDGRYPDRDKSKSLADQVAPLAGLVSEPDARSANKNEPEVQESWREALRLLVADCKDDDVDAVLLSILSTLPGEDSGKTARARATLSALCLADEPNISETTANTVLANFTSKVDLRDGSGRRLSLVDRATIEVVGSIWGPTLKEHLINEFCNRSADLRLRTGGLWGMAEHINRQKSGNDDLFYFSEIVQRLSSSKRTDRISAALAVMHAAYEGSVIVATNLINRLLSLLDEQLPERLAAAWALCWLSGGFHHEKDKTKWTPSEKEAKALIRTLSAVPPEEFNFRYFLIYTLGSANPDYSLEAVLPLLSDSNDRVRRSAIQVLVRWNTNQSNSALVQHWNSNFVEVRQVAAEAAGRVTDPESKNILVRLLNDSDVSTQVKAAASLKQRDDPRGQEKLLSLLKSDLEPVRQQALSTMLSEYSGIEKALLSVNANGAPPWIDPLQEITVSRSETAARILNVPEDEVKRTYEAIAANFALRLAWMNSVASDTPSP